ncbi:MAG: HEAT repeat domain-containing protein [Planctomycetota bacterium]
MSGKIGLTFTLVAAVILVVGPSTSSAKEKKGHPIELPKDERTAEEKKEHDKAVKKLVVSLKREKNKVMLLSRIEQWGENGSDLKRDALILFCRSSSNQEQLSGCFMALAKMGGAKSLNFLCGKTALKSRSDWAVQRAAAAALEKLGDTRAACCLIDVIKDRRQKTQVQSACLVTLAKIAPLDKKAVKTVFECADAKDDVLRSHSMTALAYLHSDASFKLLAERARKENNGQVRSFACEALGLHGDRRGIEVLREVIRKDNALQVKDAAMKALKELGAGV